MKALHIAPFFMFACKLLRALVFISLSPISVSEHFYFIGYCDQHLSFEYRRQNTVSVPIENIPWMPVSSEPVIDIQMRHSGCRCAPDHMLRPIVPVIGDVGFVTDFYMAF